MLMGNNCPSMKQSKSGTVQSGDKLLKVIEAIYELRETGVTELADHLGWQKSSIHKYLKTLYINGFVDKNGGKYHLNLKFLKYGGYMRDTSPLFQAARPVLRELVNETGEMVSFSLKDREQGVFVFMSNDQYDLVKRIQLGERFYLHQNAAGKAILSSLDDDEVDRIISQTGLPAKTKETITDRRELFKQLEKVRKQGYAISNEERTKGVNGYAAPVYDPRSDQFGAIIIVSPSAQPFDEGEAIARLLKSAQKVNLRLEYGNK